MEDWKPNPKYAHLYEARVLNGKTYFYRKDKLKDKEEYKKLVSYDQRELPEPAPKTRTFRNYFTGK